MKHLASAVMFLIIALACAPSAFANHIDSASVANVDCNHFCVDIKASGLFGGRPVTIEYKITMISPSGVKTTASYFATDTADDNGILDERDCFDWLQGPLNADYTVTGTATLTNEFGETTGPVTIDFGGSGSTDVHCGTVSNGKTFSMKNSMEGDLAHIMPGDWISGGYSFKFNDGKHAATTYTVTSSITLPVYCPDGGGPGGNILIPLGTQIIPILAGDTSWKRTGDQNNILAWEGAIQAPNLCGGKRMRNQIGATFTSTVSQNPQVGLVDWRFHYRDPAAKGKPNTDCTDADDPNRNRADVCGASWSQTFRDP